MLELLAIAVTAAHHFSDTQEFEIGYKFFPAFENFPESALCELIAIG